MPSHSLILYVSLSLFTWHFLTAKTAASSDFEKSYKRHCLARTNVQKAREKFDCSAAQHTEDEGKCNELHREFRELKKSIVYVSTVRTILTYDDFFHNFSIYFYYVCVLQMICDIVWQTVLIRDSVHLFLLFVYYINIYIISLIWFYRASDDFLFPYFTLS